MSQSSTIEWTDATWNPVTGCDRVSPGCAHCYALTLAKRLKAMGQPHYQNDGGKTSGPGFGLTLHPDTLSQPLSWRRPRMVFVNSMSDLFHEQIPDQFIARVFVVMALAQRHTFQVLTKRPERMRELLRRTEFIEMVESWLDEPELPMPWPLPNVWLGTSIENRRFIGRADVLRQVPAAVRFISAEPLLGPLLGRPVWFGEQRGAPQEFWWPDPIGASGERGLDLTGINWLIAGGESGTGHRPVRAEWIRDLRDACQRDHNDVVGLDRPHAQFPRWALNGTAFFFKQWGGLRPKAGGRELDGRTWDEMPTVTTNREESTVGSRA